MIVTKYTHSCLYVEYNETTIVIDPGNYSYEAHKEDVLGKDKIDYLLITHNHPDHMHLPFIKEIIEKHEDIKVLSDPESRSMLEKEGIEMVNSIESISLAQAPHEKVFGITPPENVLFEIFGQLSHPGDSLNFDLKTPILALPVQAPWCSLTQAVEFALSQKPKVIIPIHDWHWNAQAREAFYNRLEKYFAEQNIEFLPLISGTPQEITV